MKEKGTYAICEHRGPDQPTHPYSLIMTFYNWTYIRKYPLSMHLL